MNSKKFSIITINYNNKIGLLETIKSVVDQSYRDFEFIIIDGGSTDGSLQIIEEFNDKIDYWVSEPDRGIYHAMNKGVRVTVGEYCNFMNSGDSFYNNKVLENVFHKSLNKDILIGIAKTLHRTIPPPYNPTLDYFYKGKPLNHQAAFIKKHLLLKYPYDEVNYKIVSDTRFFVNAFILENCSYQPLDLAIVNFDENGIGSRNFQFNRIEQSKVLTDTICPRILEDYSNLLYTDYFIVQFAIAITKFISPYLKYFKINLYWGKLIKLLKN